jgi:hypothetical protein
MSEEVDIGGTEYSVAFPVGALREFETVTGSSFLNGTAQEKILSIDGITIACWIGVKWGNYKFDGVQPKAKLSVLGLSDLIPLEEFTNPDGPVKKIMAILLASLPKAKNVEAAGNAA